METFKPMAVGLLWGGFNGEVSIPLRRSELVPKKKSRSTQCGGGALRHMAQLSNPAKWLPDYEGPVVDGMSKLTPHMRRKLGNLGKGFPDLRKVRAPPRLERSLAAPPRLTRARSHPHRLLLRRKWTPRTARSMP